MVIETIRSAPRGRFPGAAIEIVDRTGGGDHFHVTVARSAFNGLALVEQHRLVNRALAGPIDDGTITSSRITTKGIASEDPHDHCATRSKP